MKYAAKRIAMLLVTMIIVSLLAFVAFDLISGDAASAMLGTEATPEKIAALREELGLSFYIAKAPDACLTVYPESEWQKVLDHCNELPASKARAMRFFFANVAKCEPDKQGRFLLPESFREYAGIDQEVIFLGQAGRAEIWSAERYEAEEAKYLNPEAIAAVMEELGF